MKILHNYRVGTGYDLYPWFVSNITIEHKSLRLQTFSNKVRYINENLTNIFIKRPSTILTPIGTSWKPV